MRVRVLLLAAASRVCSVLGAEEDVVISLTDPAIVYTPYICDDGARDCATGGWQRSTTETGAMVITTNGTSDDALPIVPQMFMQFRGSALRLATSALSTADVRVQVSQRNRRIAQNVTSRTGLIAVIGLDGRAPTTLVLTPAPPGRLVLSQLWATVDAEIASVPASYLPPPSAPPPASLPSFPATSASGGPTVVVSQPPAGHRRDLAYPLGLTLGLGLGLTLLAVGAYIVWRRWRLSAWKRREEEVQEHAAWERRKGKLRDDFVE